MLRGGQVGLSETNVTSELVEEHCADIDDSNHGHNQMPPVSVGVLGYDISPRKLIETGDVPSTTGLCPILEVLVFTTRLVQRKKHR